MPSITMIGQMVVPQFLLKIWVIGISSRSPMMTPESQTEKPSTSNESTGIGLALVKKIVEGEGGQIWLDDQQVKGTCFCFTWVRSNSNSPEQH